MNYQLPDWLQDFSNALLDLDIGVRDRRMAMTLDEAADTLVAISRFRDDLKIIQDQLSHAVTELMALDEVGELQTKDGSKIEKKGDVNRTGWKHKDLAQEVISRLTQMSVDMDTGEIVTTGPEMALRILDFVQPSYWRVKELSSIGINADNFSKVGEYKESVIVRKAKN